MTAPKENFVGNLQTKCLKAREGLPEYINESTGDIFKCTCKLKNWTTEGTGFTKKLAKQNAACQMLQKIDQENLFKNSDESESNGNLTRLSSVSKLLIYSQKEKKQQPVFSDLGKENEFFVYECSFEGHSTTGKGISKKEAKEKAANEVACLLNVHQYHNNLIKSKQRREILSNPTQQLFEYCQKYGFASPIFEEKEVVDNKTRKYQVICYVNNLTETSEISLSKKAAKFDASSLALQKLKSQSSSDSNILNTFPTQKYPSPDNSPPQSPTNSENRNSLSKIDPSLETNPTPSTMDEKDENSPFKINLPFKISLSPSNGERTEENSPTKRHLPMPNFKEQPDIKSAKFF